MSCNATKLQCFRRKNIFVCILHKRYKSDESNREDYYINIVRLRLLDKSFTCKVVKLFGFEGRR